jgi:hypothetical protein
VLPAPVFPGSESRAERDWAAKLTRSSPSAP